MATTPYPVDSATRTCCGGIGTHTRDCTHCSAEMRYLIDLAAESSKANHPSAVPLPPAAVLADAWEVDEPPYRFIKGANHAGDSNPAVGWVCATAVQYRDGSIDQTAEEGPMVMFDLTPLTIEQARALAAALTAAAGDAEGWAAR